MNRKEEMGKIIDDLDKAMEKFQQSRKIREENKAKLLELINEPDKSIDEANAACREAIRKTLKLYNEV